MIFLLYFCVSSGLVSAHISCIYLFLVGTIGTMSLSTIHEWVQALFPDVPPRLDEYIGNERYYFRNTFTGAITMCDFRSNEILIESESASTIAIAKETMTRFANYRRVNIQEYVTPNDGSVPSFLGLVRIYVFFCLVCLNVFFFFFV